VPVYGGEEMEQLVIGADLLNHPVLFGSLFRF
jgi:hypothetical protein